MKLRNKLYIKASGQKLKNITQHDGFVCCYINPIRSYFLDRKKLKQNDEQQFLELINNNIIHSETHGAPSMETGFHTVLPSKYVIHLHSVYANIFTCMKNGEYFIKKIFKDTPFVIIDYINPGYELAYFLAKRKSLPPLIFLKNHGIIIHGDKPSQCLQLIQLVHKLIEEYLQTNNVFFPFSLSQPYAKMQKFVFPDSAVFSVLDNKNLSQDKKKDLLEIYSAQNHILKTIKKMKQKPSYLTKEAIKKLLTMNQEKYRLEVFEK